MRRSPRRVGAALAAVAVVAAGAAGIGRATADSTPRQLTLPQIDPTAAAPAHSPDPAPAHRPAMRDGEYTVAYEGRPRYWPGWGDGVNEGSMYSYVSAVRDGAWGAAGGMQYALADSYGGLLGNGFDVPHAMLHKPYWKGDGPAPFWSSWINSRPYLGYPALNLHYPRVTGTVPYSMRQGPGTPPATAPGSTTPSTPAPASDPFVPPS
ncbi:MAG: hypothetical protein ACT4QG_01960 [Sporichthyaceae bacterium]